MRDSASPPDTVHCLGLGKYLVMAIRDLPAMLLRPRQIIP